MAINIIDQTILHDNYRKFVPGVLKDVNAVCIVGKQAELHLFDKNLNECLLGEYSNLSDNLYYWPFKASDSLVDLNYKNLKVMIKNALLRFYDHDGSHSIDGIPGDPTRIESSSTTLGFKANTLNGFNRFSILKSNDVRPGDVVKIVRNSPYTVFFSTVKDLEANILPAEIISTSYSISPSRVNTQITTAPSVNPTGGGASGGNLAAGTYYIQYTFVGNFEGGETWGSAEHSGATPVQFTIAAGNIPRVTLPSLPEGVSHINIYLTQPGGAAGTETLYATNVTTTTFDLSAAHINLTPGVPKSAKQISGTVNNVKATANSTNFVDRNNLYDVYTIVVTQSSTGGNATTARLDVTSLRGDNQTNVTPAAFGSDTTIGTKGLTVRFTTQSSHNLLVGQTWVVYAGQAWKAAQPVNVTGNYVGPEIDKTLLYKITVTRAGRYSDSTKPQITAEEINFGNDRFGPVDVNNHSLPIQFSQYGLYISFPNNSPNPGLKLNDTYFVTVKSRKTGPFVKLVLEDTVPAAIENGTGLHLEIYRKKDVILPKVSQTNPLQDNYLVSENDITLKSNITVYDNSLHDNGQLYPIPLVSGTAYVQYRAIKQNNVGLLKSYMPSSGDKETLLSEVENILGFVHPDNDIAYATYLASLNGGGNSKIYYACVVSDDKLEWKNVCNQFMDIKDRYAVALLTQDKAILDECILILKQGHNDSENEFVSIWFSPKIPNTIYVADETTSTNGLPLYGKVVANPELNQLVYNVIQLTSGNFSFLGNVQPGYKVKYYNNFNSYTELTVTKVINNQMLVVSPAFDAGIPVGQLFKVYRILNPDEVIDGYLVPLYQQYKDSSVKLVIPDEAENEFGTIPGFYLSSALAGLSTGIVSHQSLIFVTLQGFDSFNKMKTFFTNSHIYKLLPHGFVIAVDRDNEKFIRSAKTTDISEPETIDEVFVRNFQIVKKILAKYIDRFRFIANNTAEIREAIVSELNSAISRMKSVKIGKLGSMVISGRVVSIETGATPNSLNISLELTLPYLITNVNVNLVLVPA